MKSEEALKKIQHLVKTHRKRKQAVEEAAKQFLEERENLSSAENDFEKRRQALLEVLEKKKNEN